MKSIKYIVLVLMAGAFFTSCDEEVTSIPDNVINLQIADPFVQVYTTDLNLESGKEDGYVFSFSVIPGTTNPDASTINVYKQFTDGADQTQSSRVLAYTYPVSPGEPATDVVEEFGVADLVDGIDCCDLDPVVDSLASGSRWVLTFEILNADGSVAFETAERITIQFVPNPYKGTYEVIYSDYWRIDLHFVPNTNPILYLDTNWVGEQRTILALNDTAMAYPTFWGPPGFTWGDQWVFYLGVNDATNPSDTTIRVTIPTTVGDPSFYVTPGLSVGDIPPLFSGNRLITCESDPILFNHHRIDDCETFLVPDPDGDEHKLYLTWGYFTDGSGEREFYEILKRIGD